MNSKDTNRVNMIVTTVDYCELNTTATAGIPAFAITIAAIKGKLVLINGLNQIGTGTTTGVTADTRLLRSTMSDLAMKCANATLAYANSVSNNTLKALVDYNRSQLDRMKKEDVDDVCEAIHDATDANIAAVANFGATATDVSDLATAIGLYRTALQNPRQAIISKSQAIKQAKEMVRFVIDNQLKGQLDVMADTLKTENPDFWSGYYQAREVVDLGTTTAKVRGTVLDVNDVPLRNVVFAIYERGTTNKVAETKTDIKGKYSAAKLPAGNFDFSWALEGFKTVREEDVHISAGKELSRKVVMEAAIVREGQFVPGRIDTVDLNGIPQDVTNVTVEALDTNIQVFGSTTPNGGPNGNVLSVNAGQSVTLSAEDFANATSFFQNGNTFLNVQNAGGSFGGWRITFE